MRNGPRRPGQPLRACWAGPGGSPGMRRWLCPTSRPRPPTPRRPSPPTPWTRRPTGPSCWPTTGPVETVRPWLRTIASEGSWPRSWGPTRRPRPGTFTWPSSRSSRSPPRMKLRLDHGPPSRRIPDSSVGTGSSPGCRSSGPTRRRAIPGWSSSRGRRGSARPGWGPRSSGWHRTPGGRWPSPAVTRPSGRCSSNPWWMPSGPWSGRWGPTSSGRPSESGRGPWRILCRRSDGCCAR
jgi:hypothetical protein